MNVILLDKSLKTQLHLVFTLRYIGDLGNVLFRHKLYYTWTLEYVLLIIFNDIYNEKSLLRR